MARELYQKLDRGPAPEPLMAEVEASSGKVRKASWMPAVFGVAFLVAGSVTIAMANDKARLLHPAPGTTVERSTAERAAQDGAMFQTLSVAGFALGAACVAAAGVMFLFGGPSGAAVKTA